MARHKPHEKGSGRKMTRCPPGRQSNRAVACQPVSITARVPSTTLLVLGLWGWVMAVGEAQVTLTCGTKFSDLASSAVLAPLVLHGHVQYLHPMASSGLSYQARVRVDKVYKGGEFVHAENSTGSDVMVETLGEAEDRGECVGKVEADQSYFFFLKPQSVFVPSPQGPDSVLSSSSSSALSSSSSSADADAENLTVTSPAVSVFVLTALPQHMDAQAARTVEGALCPGCAVLPVIRDVRCKNCATAPVLKRAMSAKEKKSVRAGRRLALRCAAKGNPKPTYTWLKDGRVIHHSSDGEKKEGGGRGRSRGVSIFRDGGMTVRYSRQFSSLIVGQITSAEAGTYSCLAANPMGEVVQSVEVKVKGTHTTPSPPPSPPTTTTPSPPDLAADLDLPLCSNPPCDVSGGASSSSGVGRVAVEDPCDLNPCHNGGSCFVDQTEAGLRAGCQCPPDYHGNTCQFRRRLVRVDEGEGSDHHSDDQDEENEKVNSSPEADDHRDATQPLPLGSADDNSSSITDPSTDPNNDITITTTAAAPPANAANPVPETRLSPTSSDPFSRRLKKKLSRKRGPSSSSSQGGYGPRKSKTSRTGAPKLTVTECADQSYCLNGGTCKIVQQLQRRFCECLVGFAGHRCERAV